MCAFLMMVMEGVQGQPAAGRDQLGACAISCNKQTGTQEVGPLGSSEVSELPELLYIFYDQTLNTKKK